MSADIFGYFFELFHGKEQAVASCIADADIVAGHAVNGQRFDARVLPDPVVFVNDVIARFEFGVGEDAFGIFSFFLFQRAFSADTECGGSRFRICREDREARNGQFESGEKILPDDRYRSRLETFGVGRFFRYNAPGVGDFPA